MIKTIYKSPEGREIVEALYRKVLSAPFVPSFEQLFVPTETARTHVLRFGSETNPPILMIHGSASNSASWLGAVQDFTDRFCVYCVDIPGEPGLSEPLRCQLKTDEPYRWLKSLLDNLGIKNSRFVTMSLGSWYGLNLAQAEPERVTALSMITTPGLVPAKVSFLFKAIFFGILGKKGQLLLARTIWHKKEIPAELLAFQEITFRHFNPVMEAIPVFSDAQLKRITAPLQFFGGDCDALIDSVKTGARLKMIHPEAEVNILKNTGHVILDQFGAIKRFLSAPGSGIPRE